MPANDDRTFSQEIAGAVRAWFGERNKRAGDLARALGVSRPTAYDRWHGRTPYTNEEVDAVAEFLGISPYDITQTAQQMSAPAAQGESPKAPQDPWAQPRRSHAKKSVAPGSAA